VPAQDVISVTAVVRWGDQTKDAGLLEEALAWYEVAADLHPDQSSSALLRQYWLWDEAGDSDRAHALLEEAVRVDEGWRAPDEQAEAWRLWGLFLYEEERFAEAVEALTRAVEVRPKVGGTRYYLSEALYQLGMSQFAERDLKGALQSLAEALSANSRNLWAHVNYGKVLYLYDSSQAHVTQNHFLLATELNSDSVNLWANLINFWRSMGENGLANDLCDQASAEVREDSPLRLCRPQ
jgi:tetratricopeptide (TPR) repeat protein